METRTKESRRKVHSLILLIAFTAILLIVSTYAWFTTQKDVTISNLRGVVEVAESLEISLDGAKWGHEIDLADAATSLTKVTGTDSITTGSYSGNRNHVPSELFPVSASGELATGNKDLVMNRAKYNGTKISAVVPAVETQTTVTAEDYAGYFAFDIFLRNLSKADVASSDVLQLNSNSYAWVLPTGVSINDASGTAHTGDATAGLQNTLRIGFARYGDGTSAGSYIPATATQATILADNKEIKAVSIWEPNADMHVDSVIGSVATTPDNVLSTATKPATGWTDYYIDATRFFTKTIAKGTSSVENVYDWTSTNSWLKTPQTVQTGAMSDTIMPYISEEVVNLTDIEGNDFTLAKDSVTKVRVYIWMEGQDPDNTVLSSKGGGIEVQIGLAKSINLSDANAKKAKRELDIAARTPAP